MYGLSITTTLLMDDVSNFKLIKQPLITSLVTALVLGIASYVWPIKKKSKQSS